MAANIEIGKKAPGFTLALDDGSKSTSKSRLGDIIVLYFYPKDDTPGCTKEAIAFTEMAAEFKRAGAQVIGVSRDGVEKHLKFRTKHGLKIALGADEDGVVCEKFGVWVVKKMYGRTYMGIERSTFLIDQKGVIREIWRKVRVPGHADAVLEAVKAI